MIKNTGNIKIWHDILSRKTSLRQIIFLYIYCSLYCSRLASSVVVERGTSSRWGPELIRARKMHHKLKETRSIVHLERLPKNLVKCLWCTASTSSLTQRPRWLRGIQFYQINIDGNINDNFIQSLISLSSIFFPLLKDLLVYSVLFKFCLYIHFLWISLGTLGKSASPHHSRICRVPGTFKFHFPKWLHFFQ